MPKPEPISNLLPSGAQPQQTPTWISYEQALAGQEGVDCLAHEKCPECGRMPWWNGRRYQMEHGSHGKLPSDGHVVTEAGQMINLDARLQRAAASVRRSVGEKEED